MTYDNPDTQELFDSHIHLFLNPGFDYEDPQVSEPTLTLPSAESTVPPLSPAEKKKRERKRNEEKARIIQESFASKKSKQDDDDLQASNIEGWFISIYLEFSYSFPVN